MRIWAFVLFALQRASSELAQPSLCRDLPTKPFQVLTAADATALTALAVCPGANLTAVWHGSVAVSAPIMVGNGTTLSISAASSPAHVVHAGDASVNISSGSIEAVIDGNKATPLFEVYGELQLTGLTLQNGRTIITAGAGGAVFADAMSRVSLKRCKVQQNSAEYGAAIYSDAGAVVLLQEVSTVEATTANALWYVHATMSHNRATGAHTNRAYSVITLELHQEL
jgi:hypothetical protein